MANHIVITLSRQYGTAGLPVAQAVAQKLGIPCYDKELITMAAKESGLSEEAIAASEKRRTGSLLYSLYTMGTELPLADQVYIVQSNIIKELAEKESCVIVGRCADYVLRDREKTLKVFVHATMEDRVKMAHGWDFMKGKSDKEIQAEFEKVDRQRAGYYDYYTEHRWGDLENYDLTLNAALGIEVCTDIVLQAAKVMEAK